MGFALEREGDVRAAIGAYERALGIDPAMATAQFRLRWALARSGRTAEAGAVHERALALHSGYEALACVEIGRAIVEAACLPRDSAKADMAVRMYERAIALNPENAPAYVGFGHALRLKGHHVDAWRTIQRGTVIDAESHWLELDQLQQSGNGTLLPADRGLRVESTAGHGAYLATMELGAPPVDACTVDITLSILIERGSITLGIATHENQPMFAMRIDAAERPHDVVIPIGNPSLLGRLYIASHLPGETGCRFWVQDLTVKATPTMDPVLAGIADRTLGDLYGESQRHLSKSQIVFNAGATAKGARALEKAIAFDPAFASSYVRLGQARRLQGRYHEAWRCHQRGVALDPRAAELEVALFRQTGQAELLPAERGLRFVTAARTWEAPEVAFSALIGMPPKGPCRLLVTVRITAEEGECSVAVVSAVQDRFFFRTYVAKDHGPRVVHVIFEDKSPFKLEVGHFGKLLIMSGALDEQPARVWVESVTVTPLP